MKYLNANTRSWAIIGVLAFGYMAILLVVSNSYYQLMLTLVPIWAVFGLSWNLLSGYTGLVSFGHGAFFGLGAYTVTLGAAMLGLTPWIGMPVGAIVGAIAGAVIGFPTFRLRGAYFALAMLAYPLALLNIFEWLGLQEVPFPMRTDAPILFMHFEDSRIYTAIALALLVAMLSLCLIVERSAFGISLRALGGNEPAAEAAGINTFRLKMEAIILSGAIAGLAGGFYATILLVVTPTVVFGMLTSAQAMIVTLFGGIGTIWGPVIGAAILLPLSETLRAELGSVLPGLQGIVFGVAIILVVLLAPDGLYWTIRERLRRRSLRANPEIREITAGQSNLVRMVVEDVTRPGADGAVESILEIQNISKAFGGLRALSRVTVTFRRGEVLGIIGPNGAGKTTLFNVLNGFLKPDTGDIIFEGTNIVGLKPNAICRLGIGRTFQVVRTFPRMTVLENVMVGGFSAERDKLSAERAAQDALKRLEIGHLTDAGVTELTNKELRLMELARALASRPKLVLMDEPLAGLGRAECEDFIKIVQRLSRLGISIAIIEHTMHAMVRLADRLIVLDHGTVLTAGPPQAVVADPKVCEAYLGTKWSQRAKAQIA